MGYYDNSGEATPWESVDSNKLGADPRFKLIPQLLETKGYVSHAIGCAAHAPGPTHCWLSSDSLACRSVSSDRLSAATMLRSYE
jgi:hypothetical protein